jgi:hypothetical protein
LIRFLGLKNMTSFIQNNFGNARGYQTNVSGAGKVQFIGEIKVNGEEGQTNITVNLPFGGGTIKVTLDEPLRKGETIEVSEGSMTIVIKVPS